MNRVRNADEFLLCFRRISAEYERIFGPRLLRIREKYAGGPAEKELNTLLEIHARTYFVNAFLAALNWRLDQQPTDGLPNLIPEVPVRSEERGSIRLLDYLGFERETDRSLLLVETKRPSAPLPQALTPAATYSEIVSRGLAGEELLGEWREWLNTLKDYVRSVQQRSQQSPKRVLITNGDWMILFLDPQDAFLDGGSRDPGRLLVFESRDAIEQRFCDVFRHLEHQQVLGRIPALTPGELPFNVRGQEIDRALHGLRLRHIEQPGIYQPTPVIKVAPVVFLRTRHGAWLRVESPPQEFEVPHRYEDLPIHLEEVHKAAQTLLTEVNDQLRLTLQAYSLVRHYEDEDGFAALPGVREQGQGDFLLVTGDKTHYLLPEPSVPECPYHDWQACNRDSVPSNPGPLLVRSVAPRSFFVSGEKHHCAHRDVSTAKASPITAVNIDRCGSRSGREGQAFCEIWRFEQHLCCRTCAFEEVCTKAQVFRLPCRRLMLPSASASKVIRQATGKTSYVRPTLIWLSGSAPAGRGSIINAASFIVRLGAATLQLVYTASKSAVLSLIRELAVIHARENICVNALCQGSPRTELLMRYLGHHCQRTALPCTYPDGPLGEAMGIARAALLSAPNDASFTTGATLMADDGITAAYATSE